MRAISNGVEGDLERCGGRWDHLEVGEDGKSFEL
jgi:hypothetical protein